MPAGGKLGTIAGALTVLLLLAGCGGGAPGAVAPVATDVPAPPSAPAAAQVLSDAPTRVPEAAAIPAAPGAGTVSEPAPATGGAPEGGQPALAPIVVRPTGSEPAPAAPAADAAPEQPAAADPQPVAPVAPDGAAPAAAPPVAAQGEVSAAMTGRPEAAPIEPADGMSQLIEGGSNGRKEVALTFDAGADRGYAEAILDLLRDNGITASFGMTGTWAEANPDLIQRMVSEGHQLINHTWSHDSLTGANTGKPEMTKEQLADELTRTENLIRDLTGYELKPWFRPPYGDYDATTLTWLNELGYPYTAMWTCDTRGWAGWDARKIVDYCTSVPLEDDIILMHVGASAAGDYEALPELIRYYRDNGYAFVSVDQMIQP